MRKPHQYLPKITVIMPVYNGERYIREAIESILNQTFTDFEFLILNDGSTDRSVEIIESYSDSRIRLIHNEKNLKLIATLNIGIMFARGEYLARMDCDDVSLPQRLEKQVEFLDNHPDVGIVGTGFQLIDSFGRTLGVPVRFPSEHKVLQWALYFYSPIVHPSVMMRKEVILAAAGYSPKYLHAEDYDLWYRLSQMIRLANLKDTLLYLRKHETSVTNTYLEQHLKNAAKVSQLMIKESLNEEISTELIEKLRAEKHRTIEDAKQIGSLISKLYWTYCRENKLSCNERKYIRKDAAERLFNVGLPFLKDIHAWKIILLSIYLNPCIVIKSIGMRIVRLFYDVSVPRVYGV